MKSCPHLYALGVAITLLAPPSGAEGPSSKAPPVESDALTDKARQLYEEGSKAATAGRWADAYVSFFAAWKLKTHYQIASNLGVAALKIGKYRDAAEHLAFYLREAPATKVQERQRAEASLKEALAKIGAVTITVVPKGAEVTVDGTAVENKLDAVQVFLEPGQHEIVAKLDEHVTARRTVVAKAGATETVALKLEPTPVASTAVATPAAHSPATHRVDVDPLRTPLLIAGGVTAGVGFATGLVFTFLANGKSGDADALWKQVDSNGRSIDCLPATGKAPEPCGSLVDTRDTQAAFTKTAFWSFVGAGAVGIGTAVYYLVTRPPSGPEQKRAQVIPLVGPGTVGIALSGKL